MIRKLIYLFLFNLLISFPDCDFGDPNWENNFDGTFYQYTATLANAQIFIDDEEKTTGKLAAFVGDEVRGIDLNGSSFFPPAGTNIWEVSLYSNLVSGETITFKYYDDINNVVIDLGEIIDFEANAIYGSSAFDPFLLSGLALECDNENYNHFGDPAANTGVSEMIILSNSITSLDIGDQIGIFDSQGIISNDCSHSLGEILVGYGEWNGDQLEIVASSSVDYCDFANTELPGFVENNPIIIKVWDTSDQIEYETFLTISQGNHNFQETSFVVISELELGFLGCTDLQACNFDPNATIDDGDCNYSEPNYDCYGNCTVSIDCNGVCGGDAIFDECGICGGSGPLHECLDGSFVCHSSDCVDSTFPNPDLFNFVTSTNIAYYYITEVYINEINLDNSDWIAAFNGDVCVGARQWDVGMCANGVCDIALMGVNSLDDETSEYMENGDIPSFKIYDISEDTYYNAIPSNNYQWESGGVFVIDNLNESDYYCEDTPSCSGCLDEAACNYNLNAVISSTCYYLDDISLLSPNNNELLELDELPGGSLTFSWSETHESCIENPNYQIQIFNQSFNLIFSEETDDTTIDIPYDLLDIDINELNLYSWFVTGSNFFSTSDTFYFAIDATQMNLNDASFSFKLSDNYPNPFNPITEINFEIPYYSFVNINIYDISGHFIDKLTENYYSSGSYKVYWDASNYSSGVYFYEMKADNFLLRKKMMVIK